MGLDIKERKDFKVFYLVAVVRYANIVQDPQPLLRWVVSDRQCCAVEWRGM